MRRAARALLAAVGALAAACAPAPDEAARDAPAAESAAPASSQSAAALLSSSPDASAPAQEPAASAAPSASASASAAMPGAPGGPPSALARTPITRSLAGEPTRFTAAFDGSLRFSLWLRTMRFARAMQAEHGKKPRFTFFVNACFYSTEPGPSAVGRARTRSEVTVRRALTQLAINEGHEVGNHGTGHDDGAAWSLEAWRAELDRFHAILDGQLFEPVADGQGGFAFPRFTPLASAAPGEVGAACTADAQCASGRCLEIDARTALCTAPCNLHRPCPTGTSCGAPMFREDTDVCLPRPSGPIEIDGALLVDRDGNPNPKHPRLRPYRMRGHRAPYLAANDAMIEALTARGYAYDTSLGAGPGLPFRVGTRGAAGLWEYPLAPWPGARAIPMDYNYRGVRDAAEVMRRDYRAGLVAAHARGRWPWNVGHHFATWEGGAFLDVLEDTVDFALGGCPGEDGAPGCPGAEVVSFDELTRALEAIEKRPPE